MKITKKQIIEKVFHAFKEATDEVMNGESPVNMDLSIEGDTVSVYFDVDCGRGGIDSYDGSMVKFTNGKVICAAGDSLEGCGVDEEVEDRLELFAKELMVGEIISNTRTIKINYDSRAEDMVDAVETILNDLGVEFKSEGEEMIDITYELPYK